MLNEFFKSISAKLALVSSGLAIFAFYLLFSIDMEGETLKVLSGLGLGILAVIIGFKSLKQNTSRNMRVVAILSILVGIICIIITALHLPWAFEEF